MQAASTWCRSVVVRTFNVKHASLLALAAISLSALALAGCSRAGGSVLGKDPGTDSRAQSTVKDLKSGGPSRLTGVMYEKCPVAGCWFMLRDNTGVIRVDTKAAGFTVTDVPVNTQVTVSGTIKGSHEAGKGAGERILAASGMRY
jgi:hypothetical protein